MPTKTTTPLESIEMNNISPPAKILPLNQFNADVIDIEAKLHSGPPLMKFNESELDLEACFSTEKMKRLNFLRIAAALTKYSTWKTCIQAEIQNWRYKTIPQAQQTSGLSSKAMEWLEQHNNRVRRREALIQACNVKVAEIQQRLKQKWDLEIVPVTDQLIAIANSFEDLFSGSIMDLDDVCNSVDLSESIWADNILDNARPFQNCQLIYSMLLYKPFFFIFIFVKPLHK